jgi:uncharacterized phage-associated protein
MSKKQKRELEEMEKEKKRKMGKKVKSAEDIRIQRDLKKELKKSEAIIDTKKIKKVFDQIMGKYYYIMFKIIREYPKSKHFSIAINSILKHAGSIDASLLRDITRALLESYDE